MAPMWSVMEDCREWYTDYGMQVPPGLKALAHPSWDWITVAGFTCSGNCHDGPEAWTVCEEQVFAFNGLEGHSAHAEKLFEFLEGGGNTT